MSRFVRLFACVLLTLAIITSAMTINVFAEGTTTINVDVTYGQTEARSMLDMINDFRTDSEGGAWYWNADNTTKTVFNTEGNTVLEPLKYDYELEKAAMQRAAEIAVSFDHTRPDGTGCFTVFPSGYSTKGENIAAGYSSASAAFVGWQETDEPHEEQGHRINMLNPGFNAIGIGHVVMNGAHYWVQILGYTDADTSVTSANDSDAVVAVEAATGSLTFVEAYCETDSYELEVNETVTAPDMVAAYQFDGHWPSYSNIITRPDAVWTSSDDTIAVVTDGKIVASKIGSAVLTASSGGHEAEVSVTVTPISLADADITLEYTEIDYTGKEFKPTVTSVKLGEKTLTEGTDYTVAYSDNKAVGTAKVTVTGTGNYDDFASTTFTINECSHTLDGGTETKKATCTEDGVMTYACTKCDYTNDEPIAAKGHSLDDGTETKKATCTEDGIMTYACANCDYSEDKPIAAIGHTPGDETTCGTAQLCTVCKVTLAEATGKHSDADKDGKCDVCSADMTQPTSSTSSTTTTTTTTAETDTTSSSSSSTTTTTTKRSTTTTKNNDKDENDEYPETGDNNSGSIIALIVFCSSALIVFFIIFNEKLQTKINHRTNA